MTMAARLPATMRSRSLCLRSGYVGLITNEPSSSPTRTAAMGCAIGMDEMASAADAPVSASTSESFSGSADRSSAMICVSRVHPSGNRGRNGRSIRRLVRTSFSVGLPSRLKNPPGIRPDA